MKNFKQYLNEKSNNSDEDQSVQSSGEKDTGFLFPELKDQISQGVHDTLVAIAEKIKNSGLASLTPDEHERLDNIRKLAVKNKTPATPAVATISTNNTSQMKIINPHEVAYDPLANISFDPTKKFKAKDDDDD